MAMTNFTIKMYINAQKKAQRPMMGGKSNAGGRLRNNFIFAA
jgi:hypothetical protein